MVVAFWSRLFHKKGQGHPENNPGNSDLLETGEELEEDEESETGDGLFSEDVTEASSTYTENEEEYEIVEREIHPAKIICPDCGGITLEGLEFCDKCGGELQ
jgi:hypothetical protein